VRFLIISDLHANLEALQAVLEDAAEQYDRIICCGDLVGYNSDPAAVLDWAVQNCHSIIRGNHDKVVAGIDDLSWFNPVAQTSALWTQKQLSAEQLQVLRDLPQGPAMAEQFEFMHGAVLDEDEYMVSGEDTTGSFQNLQEPLAFFGHTHIQGGFFKKRRWIKQIDRMRPSETAFSIELEPETLYLINPGSVGQPRDGDPRAAYALYEPELRVVHFRRVAYPIKLTAEKIRLAGLPDVLGLRLFHGQ
jgi:predicted phosphodiesterase